MEVGIARRPFHRSFPLLDRTCRVTSLLQCPGKGRDDLGVFGLQVQRPAELLCRFVELSSGCQGSRQTGVCAGIGRTDVNLGPIFLDGLGYISLRFIEGAKVSMDTGEVGLQPQSLTVLVDGLRYLLEAGVRICKPEVGVGVVWVDRQCLTV